MATDDSHANKVSRDEEMSRDRSPSLVTYAENGGHAVVKTLQDCLTFMKVRTPHILNAHDFKMRTLVQTFIGKMLGRIGT
jgi:hypothetical protein